MLNYWIGVRPAMALLSTCRGKTGQMPGVSQKCEFHLKTTTLWTNVILERIPPVSRNYRCLHDNTITFQEVWGLLSVPKTVRIIIVFNLRTLKYLYQAIVQEIDNIFRSSPVQSTSGAPPNRKDSQPNISCQQTGRKRGGRASPGAGLTPAYPKCHILYQQNIWSFVDDQTVISSCIKRNLYRINSWVNRVHLLLSLVNLFRMTLLAHSE